MFTAPIKILIFLLFLYFISCNKVQPKHEVNYTRSYKIADITIIDSLPPANDYLPFDSLNSYGINAGEHRYPLRIRTPLNYGLYPIYLIDTIKAQSVIPKILFDNHLDTIYSLNFANQKEITHSLKISVITNIDASIQNLYFTKYDSPLRDSLFLFKAYPILIQNIGRKPILLDRGSCFRAFLEAKDEKGRWRRVENVLKWTCGIDWQVGGNGSMAVNILPVNGIMIAKMFQPNGDYETECRLRYQFYNTVSDSYFPSGPNTGHWVRGFYADHEAISPIYSNIFKLKIHKAQFRKLNDDWFYDSPFQ